MANEIKTQFTSGATVYAIVLNAAGQAWRTDTSGFESLSAANWTDYSVAMSEQPTTGIYEGNFPTAIVTAGTYYILFRQQGSGSPNSTDQTNGMTGGTIFWGGSAEVFPLTEGGSLSVTVAGYASGQDPASLLIANEPFLDAMATAAAGFGVGPVALNQNTGGTDNLRYVDSNGDGVEGADVLIYLATNWPSQPDLVAATATTGPDGRWIAPAYVQSGTYIAVFTKIGADGPDVSPPFSV